MEKQKLIAFADFTAIDLKKVMDDVYSIQKIILDRLESFINVQFAESPMKASVIKD
jgi:hypothetical protein